METPVRLGDGPNTQVPYYRDWLEKYQPKPGATQKDLFTAYLSEYQPAFKAALQVKGYDYLVAQFNTINAIPIKQWAEIEKQLDTFVDNVNIALAEALHAQEQHSGHVDSPQVQEEKLEKSLPGVYSIEVAGKLKRFRGINSKIQKTDTPITAATRNKLEKCLTLFSKVKTEYGKTVTDAEQNILLTALDGIAEVIFDLFQNDTDQFSALNEAGFVYIFLEAANSSCDKETRGKFERALSGIPTKK